MSAEDFPFAVQATNLVGWNLSEGDFEFALELEPDGCFILVDNTERIGIATTVNYGRIGWFGNLFVIESHRKKGAGSLLVKHSIEYLQSKNVETVGLYAYQERIPFYKRLGFKLDSEFIVLKGRSFSSPSNASLRELKKADLQTILEFDSSCFGSPRKKLLEPILLDEGNLCYLCADEGQIVGYAVAKVYGEMTEIGPLVCQKSHNDVAMDLLKALLNRLQNLEISTYVPEKEASILDMLKRFGFKENFRVARMFLGHRATKECISLPESLERG
ncbi:MAG TPA: GNAT family N-acetyltransferase [Candidatus Acidoferrum sp.]|jgi:GNAT superfamily N-acetyltransferase|nr:GNAT family N-acetyltransferase [Candidatus Acidoferrum sp.]